MSQIYNGGFITVTAAGGTIVTGAASARIAIPVASDGNRPRFIRVSGINACYVRIGDSSVVATNGDTLIQPAAAVLMHVPNGVTHIAAIQDTAAGRVNVVPLENI